MKKKEEVIRSDEKASAAKKNSVKRRSDTVGSIEVIGYRIADFTRISIFPTVDNVSKRLSERIIVRAVQLRLGAPRALGHGSSYDILPIREPSALYFIRDLHPLGRD